MTVIIGLQVNEDMEFSTNDEGNPIRFFPDSAEQIARSMEMLGLQDKLHEAFQVAIARARGHSQMSRQAAANTGAVDPVDDALPE